MELFTNSGSPSMQELADIIARKNVEIAQALGLPTHILQDVHPRQAMSDRTKVFFNYVMGRNR